jgi:hypothetical protein
LVQTKKAWMPGSSPGVTIRQTFVIASAGEAIQSLRHSGMRRRDKIAKLFCAEGAGPAIDEGTRM